MMLDFSRCRKVWVPDESEAGGFWSPPPPHVEAGVRFIVEHPWALLGDAMGGMKTAQSIIAAQFLHNADKIDQVIVVAPASVRPKVWFDEDLGQLAEQAFDDKRIVAIEYHNKVKMWTRGPAQAKPLTFYITNYEFVRSKANLAALLPHANARTMLILDESSAVRTWDSAQTEACMQLRWRTNAKDRPIHGAPRCGRVLELNGTPVGETPMDMFSQMNMLHPDILECRYVSHFETRYAVKVPVLGANGPLANPYAKRQADGTVKNPHITKVEGWTNLDDLTARCAPYILRREAKDFGVSFGLPAVGWEFRLSKETWDAYRDMRDEMVIWLKSGVATSATAAIRSMRLSQITSGFVGGVEDPCIEPVEGGLFDDHGSALGGDRATTDGDRADARGPDGEADVAVVPDRRQQVTELGRERLDFALERHAELLKRDPDLKLLMWCRFVPELTRLLREERLTFPSIPVGAVCGQKVLEGEHRQRDERDYALRLLHPKTAPPGPATVGATAGTGALGLNMTACHTVIDVSYDFSSMKKRQGDARVDRTGQTRPVSFFYLIAVGPKGQKTIDHHVMLTRTGKMRLADWTTSAWVRALKEE